MRGNSVETLDLSRMFKIKHAAPILALKNVTLSIRSGEIFGVLGPNGAGKTTLIKILTTLLLPSSGKAYVHGYDLEHEASRVRPIINLVSGGETPGYGILNVKDNLWFFSQLYGLDRAASRQRITKLLEEMQLSDYANVRMHKLSTGYKQRLNLARGFINNPRILFLDEPTLGLDVAAARHIRTQVKKWIAEDSEHTVLLTTHHMAEAEELCDRVALINDGQIVALATPSELKRNLHGNESYEVKVKGIVQELDRLKAIPSVIAVHNESDISSGTTSLKLLLTDEEGLSSVLSILSSSGNKVLYASRNEPTLEDVYMCIVGQRIAQSE